MNGAFACIAVGALVLGVRAARRSLVVFEDPVDHRIERHRAALGPRSIP